MTYQNHDMCIIMNKSLLSQAERMHKLEGDEMKRGIKFFMMDFVPCAGANMIKWTFVSKDTTLFPKLI